MAAFSAARLVLGFSGAGLANSIWMADDAVLVELLTTSFDRTAYGLDAPADAHRVDATQPNDFSAYMARLGRLYVQVHATNPVPWTFHANPFFGRFCKQHSGYYYSSRCVHEVRTELLLQGLIRARALLLANAALPASPWRWRATHNRTLDRASERG